VTDSTRERFTVTFDGQDLPVDVKQQADGKLVGDVEFDVAVQRAGWITPVPGGVGPMTRACLLENTLHAAEHLHG